MDMTLAVVERQTFLELAIGGDEILPLTASLLRGRAFSDSVVDRCSAWLNMYTTSVKTRDSQDDSASTIMDSLLDSASNLCCDASDSESASRVDATPRWADRADADLSAADAFSICQQQDSAACQQMSGHLPVVLASDSSCHTPVDGAHAIIAQFCSDIPGRNPAPPVHLRRQKVEPWRLAGVQDLEDAPCNELRTTIVIKGLPEGCTREALCLWLDSAGFAGLYDFLYIPAHFRAWTLMRYAFANFTSEAAALQTFAELPQSSWPAACGVCPDAEDAVIVAFSEEHQGFDVHVERYRNSPIMHKAVPDMYEPILLKNGQRAKFPAPTKRIQAPRSLLVHHIC